MVFLFQADFASVNDYVSFLYVNPRPTDEASPRPIRKNVMGQDRKIHVTFPELIVRPGAEYVLLYITEDSSSVLGMSEPFLSYQSLGK